MPGSYRVQFLTWQNQGIRPGPGILLHKAFFCLQLFISFQINLTRRDVVPSWSHTGFSQWEYQDPVEPHLHLRSLQPPFTDVCHEYPSSDRNDSGSHHEKGSAWRRSRAEILKPGSFLWSSSCVSLEKLLSLSGVISSPISRASFSTCIRVRVEGLKPVGKRRYPWNVCVG